MIGGSVFGNAEKPGTRNNFSRTRFKAKVRIGQSFDEDICEPI